MYMKSNKRYILKDDLHRPFFSPLTMMMMPSYTLLCFQLMRQIDLMVSAKKAEWETHVHAVQIQLDKKTKEVEFVKVQLEQKCQEVSVLY